MADAYWRYTDAGAMPPPAVKRPRSEFDLPSEHGLGGFYPNDDRIGLRGYRDSQSIGASYDHYLRSGQIPSLGGIDSVAPVSAGIRSTIDDPRLMGVGDPGVGRVGRDAGYAGRIDQSLPPDASNTLFVEGLPANTTRREVSHIFRPFVGFKEVRLVTKESRLPGGQPLILCFVDFTTPGHAAVALDILQGYKFDEHDRDSAILRLQFARFPGPRGGGGRGKH